MATIASQLSELANKYNLAVIVINQMTTKSSTVSELSDMEVNGDNPFTTKLIPALGEFWAHATTTRLLLMMDPNPDQSDGNERRICKLVKSVNRPCGTSLFHVTPFGIRDCLPAYQ